ncbi:cation:proton antiporter [Streptomyces sp. BI20]|uniref:cation:proton antiporter n=1 Tax=Streptomyces sp. BI20 TaxID=3403460 RepID=UPI003C773CCE
MAHVGTLILIMAIAVLAPLLVHALGRWCAIPLVVVEILLGVLIGPDVLGWAHGGEVLDVLSHLGLAMLIFLAGHEIEFDRIRGDTLNRSLLAWLVTLALGLGVGTLVAGGDFGKGVFLGTALTSTALGAILPMLSDAGELRGRFGSVVMAMGSVGEFGPIVAMALLLGTRAPGRSALVLIAFGLITAGAVWWALRPKPAWLGGLITRTLDTSSQFAVRLIMLLLVAMLGLAGALGIDTLLGAFAAGVLTRLVLRAAAPDSGHAVLARVEALGFGFLVPIFFVVTGIEFDLRSLLSGGRPLLLVPVFLLLFLLLRGGPVRLLAPRDLGGRDRTALALFSSTALPLVVAITTLGVEDGAVRPGEAAALVAAGMVSVLLFPLLARRARAGGGAGAGTAAGRGKEAEEAW